MRLYLMFVTDVCVLFLIKLRWLKKRVFITQDIDSKAQWRKKLEKLSFFSATHKITNIGGYLNRLN